MPRAAAKQTRRSWTMASRLWWNTVWDAENTRKSLHRLTFWAHREEIMGIHGHGQLMPRLLKAGPTKFRRRSEPRSSLYVIVRLTRAAKGNGSVSEEHPPTKKVLISTMLNYGSGVGKKSSIQTLGGAIFCRSRE